MKILIGVVGPKVKMIRDFVFGKLLRNCSVMGRTLNGASQGTMIVATQLATSYKYY